MTDDARCVQFYLAYPSQRNKYVKYKLVASDQRPAKSFHSNNNHDTI